MAAVLEERQAYPLILDGVGDPCEQLAPQLVEYLQGATYQQALDLYADIHRSDYRTPYLIRRLAQGDRFYLLTAILHRPDARDPWLYERCREVEAQPDGMLDLWAREHYKSTIITFAGSLQEILNDPGITIGIFSINRSLAKDFLSMLKGEMENNDDLRVLFPDIIWQNTRKAPAWSNEGITVIRDTNPRECTVEAWGLIEGLPTGKHFALLVYDDVITERTVNTPDQILKATERWELSLALGRQRAFRAWHIGTRYSYSDPYDTIMKRKAAKPRIYPATENGKVDGKLRFMKPDAWKFKLDTLSMFTLACQYLQDPLAGSEMELQPEWLRYWEVRPRTLNIYITVDYAGAKPSAQSSRTAFSVTGVDSRMNKYLLDGACHRMPLSERWKLLKYFHHKWITQRGVQSVRVGYERYGAQSDIEHFNEMMRLEPEAGVFEIEEVSWPRESMTGDKDTRIRRLEPDFRNWRYFLPYVGKETAVQRDAKARGEADLVSKAIRRIDESKKVYDLGAYFVQNEYLHFPATTHKDMLDAMSRIYDMDMQPPMVYSEADLLPEATDV